jgi:hypothetical protein
LGSNKPISTTWVLTEKPEKTKARLCSRGYEEDAMAIDTFLTTIKKQAL